MKILKSIFGQKVQPKEKVIVPQIGEMNKGNGFWDITINGVDLTFDCEDETIPKESIEIWISIKNHIDQYVDQSLEYLNSTIDKPQLTKTQFDGVTIIVEDDSEDFRINFEDEESFTFYSTIFKNNKIIDYDAGD